MNQKDCKEIQNILVIVNIKINNLKINWNPNDLCIKYVLFDHSFWIGYIRRVKININIWKIKRINNLFLIRYKDIDIYRITKIVVKIQNGDSGFQICLFGSFFFQDFYLLHSVLLFFWISFDYVVVSFYFSSVFNFYYFTIYFYR